MEVIYVQLSIYVGTSQFRNKRFMLYEIIYIGNFVFVLHFECNFGFVKADAPHGI